MLTLRPPRINYCRSAVERGQRVGTQHPQGMGANPTGVYVTTEHWEDSMCLGVQTPTQKHSKMFVFW